ncbi:unnamed protein product [Rhizophagus irregularis]|uniref:Uncharacterized protein n=1 Tax=Rhizophagus irregularis TaxID=588596 RepID=A0A915Z2W8_9GLOM|nr:unnamed protein product [Rhizophagus irregularis]
MPMAMLTAAQKVKRIEWAQNHLNDRWEKTLFSDETAFQLFRDTIKYWHKDPRPIRPLPKNRQKVLAWAGFCAKEKQKLEEFLVEGEDFNRIAIRSIQVDLRKNPFKRTFPILLIGLQTAWTLTPLKIYRVLIVKHNVEKRMPQNIDEMKQFIAEEWNKIPDSFLVNLIQSMKRRCQLVIERNGKRIPY